MTHEPKILRDGIMSLLGGMDSGMDPSIIQPTQAAYLSNLMVRGGFPETRYGFKKRKLIFENDEQEAWFGANLFQGADFYLPTPTRPLFVCSIGGRLFTIDPINRYEVREITPIRITATTGNFISPPVGSSVDVGMSDTSLIQVGYPLTIRDGQYLVTAKTVTSVSLTNYDATPGVLVASGTTVYYLHPNNATRPRIWTLQAENYFLIQDGSDACIIYDGATARRANRTGTQLEVPTGTSMAYWNGRIWVAVNQREIEAGNIFEADNPSSILEFTETLYLAEGGKFRVAEPITALRVLPVLDTSLGQGPLQVHTASSVSSLNLPVERARWKDIDSPVQPLGLVNYGASSDYGTIVVNGDVWFRAPDGLRSYVLARRDFNSPGNVPASREMQRIMDNDDQQFLQYGSAVLFKNLLIFTVNPLPVRSGTSAYWRGLGVLDFDLLSGIGGKSDPVYAGVWTGVNVNQVLKGKFVQAERCFMFVRNAEGLNEFWEMDPDSRFDGDGGRIKSVIESREMDFDKALTLHTLMGSELWVSDIRGLVNFTLQFKPGQANCWSDWGERELCVTARECPPDGCFAWQTFRPGYKTRLGFAQPPQECDSLDNRPSRTGYTHAIRLEIEGHARLKGLLVKAREESEPPHASCT
jgi:hypothetical protein